MKFNDVLQVAEWTSEQSEVSLFHLGLLTGGFRGQREKYIEVCTHLAQLLKPQPEITKALISHPNWRYNLVGNVVAILQREAAFEADLTSRIGESWVAPQLAAGLALVTKGVGIPQLETFMYTMQEDWQCKAVLSSYAALKLMGHKSADTFETDPHFEMMKSKDRANCIIRTFRHWEIWKEISPVK